MFIVLRSSLGGVPGVPKVHFKGRQGEYYVMVSAVCPQLVYMTHLHVLSAACREHFQHCRLWTSWDPAYGMYGTLKGSLCHRRWCPV